MMAMLGARRGLVNISLCRMSMQDLQFRSRLFGDFLKRGAVPGQVHGGPQKKRRPDGDERGKAWNRRPL